MKRKRFYLMLVVFLFFGYLVIVPADVKVGDEVVKIDESIATKYLKNSIGRILGYGNCNITGLSFYDRECVAFRYSSDRGVIFSGFVRAPLEKMIKEGRNDEAYNICQNAFEKIQEKWGDEEKKKIIYPLSFMF